MKTTTRKKGLALFVTIIMVLGLWTATPIIGAAADNEVTVGAFTISRADGESLTLGNAAEYGNGDYFYAEEEYGVTVAAPDVTSMGVLHINTSEAVIIEMKENVTATSTGRIQVNTAEDVTSEVEIQDVKIEYDTPNAISPFSVKGGGELDLTITGGNVFDTADDNSWENTGAALQLENGSDLVIDGNGSLYAEATFSAGIGAGATSAENQSANAGDITINGGMVTATSLKVGAGIGAGLANSANDSANVGNITINGGTVTATGGWGAGIGGGRTMGDNSTTKVGDIEIRGGMVEAICLNGSAGIGAGVANGVGSSVAVGDIKISGGTVIATHGNAGYGPGIGAGYAIGISSNADANAVTISGGVVTAEGGGISGAGIGGGRANAQYAHTNVNSIEINGGMVTAKAFYGAGIGAGYVYDDTTPDATVDIDNITINGGTVVANNINVNAQDIGNGYKVNGTITPLTNSVTINGGSVIPVNNKIAYGNPVVTVPKNSAGDPVYANTIDFNPTLTSGDVIYAARIDGVNAAYTPDAASGAYGVRDMKALDIGTGGIGVKDIAASSLVAAVLWLPEESVDGNVTLTARTASGAAQYTDDYNRGAAAISRTLEKENIVDLFLATFDMQGHGTPIDPQIISVNDKATEPAQPTDTKYGFLGWYTSNTYETPFNFTDTAITEDTVIYSDWAAKPVITTGELPDGTVGTAYNQTLAATGDAPITWELDNGALPGGLSLNETSGAITGTPTAAGTSNFTVEATNAGGSVTKALSITIVALPPPPPTTYSVTVTNGSGSASYEEGATVNITANAPTDGKVFDKWTSSGITLADPTSATTSFTMPANAVTVTATYKDDGADVTDTDGDGVPDDVEGEDGTDPNDPGDFKDTDEDGVPDYIEEQDGTDPTDKNSFKDENGDGIPDYVQEHQEPLNEINGWVYANGAWKYYVDSVAKTGWLYDTDYKAWFYFDKATEIMKTGWVYDGGIWYYLAGNGAMKTSWAKDDGSWYYLRGNGAMVWSKWLKDTNGSWYYLSGNGKMLTGTKKIGGKSYTFKTNGVWID
jgi:hypothetical protein